VAELRPNRGGTARARPFGRALALSLRVCALAAAAGIAAGAAAAVGGPVEGTRTQPALVVAVGFDGAVRPGAPTPVDVQTPPMPSDGAAQVVIETTALTPQTGRAVVSTVVPFRAVTGVVERLRVPIVIQDVRRPLRVRVMLGGRRIAAAAIPFDPARVAGRMVVLVSDTQAGLGVLRDIDERAVDAYVAPGALPGRWQEYAGVDLVVLRDVDPARLSDAQRDALVTWVRLGGRLVVIARPGRGPLPAFLLPVLPARLGTAGVLGNSDDLAAKYGAALPAGPIAAVALLPRPRAEVVRAGGRPVVAAAAAGDGYASVWGIDPTTGPLADWPGRQRLWGEALGAPVPALVDPSVLGERLSPRIPVDRRLHILAGLLIALYVGGLAIVRRRRPTAAGAAAGAVAAALAVAVFANLAASARARSTALTQVAVLQQARDAPAARVLVVAAAAVPYGGPVTVLAPAGTVAAPVTMIGDLSIQWREEAAVLAGRVRPDLPWVFQALAAVPLSASARYDAGTETLSTDLGTAGLRDAGLWWHGFVYGLGDVPAGQTTRRIAGGGWRRAAEIVADDASPARFFRAPDNQAPGGIVQLPHPVLVGRWPGRAPAFALAAGLRSGGEEPQDTILIVPVDGPPPQVPRSEP
jgi:hypothetical protein